MLFEEYEKNDSSSLPQNIKFEIAVDKKHTFGERTALNTQVSDIATLTTNIGAPLCYLFNEQVMKLYFELFSYILRLRHMSLMLRNVWVILTKELSRDDQ